jgi:hypothetical protein
MAKQYYMRYGKWVGERKMTAIRLHHADVYDGKAKADVPIKPNHAIAESIRNMSNDSYAAHFGLCSMTRDV